MKINEAVQVTIHRGVKWNQGEGKIGYNVIVSIKGRSFLLRPGKDQIKIHVGDCVSDEIVDNELGIYDLTVLSIQ